MSQLLYAIRTPIVWHKNEGISFASVAGGGGQNHFNFQGICRGVKVCSGCFQGVLPYALSGYALFTLLQGSFGPLAPKVAKGVRSGFPEKGAASGEVRKLPGKFPVSRSEMWVPKRGGLKFAGKRQESATFLQRSFFDVAVQFSFAAAQLLVQMTSSALQKSQCCSAVSAAQHSENCSATSFFACGRLQGRGLEGWGLGLADWGTSGEVWETSGEPLDCC